MYFFEEQRTDKIMEFICILCLDKNQFESMTYLVVSYSVNRVYPVNTKLAIFILLHLKVKHSNSIVWIVKPNWQLNCALLPTAACTTPGWWPPLNRLQFESKLTRLILSSFFSKLSNIKMLLVIIGKNLILTKKGVLGFAMKIKKVKVKARVSHEYRVIPHKKNWTGSLIYRVIFVC